MRQWRAGGPGISFAPRALALPSGVAVETTFQPL
jgi:hypothetical protein